MATAGEDAQRVIALYDDPEQLRARIMRLIRRFYDEWYRHDEQRRSPIMRRSVLAHRARGTDDPQQALDSLTGRHISCIEEADEPYETFIFVPSVDVGAYLSCSDTPPVHGVFYPAGHATIATEDPGERAERMALVYKALADPQRLRILGLLAEKGELYAQQIVDATGISQSVVSRHLTFMKAVGLVSPRRQNNMKFFSLNRSMRSELRDAVDAIIPSA
jgi:DNA-binding transcriptional ArsR family regulator